MVMGRVKVKFTTSVDTIFVYLVKKEQSIGELFVTSRFTYPKDDTFLYN